MDILWCLLSTHSVQGCFYQKKLPYECFGILASFISTSECFFHRPLCEVKGGRQKKRSRGRCHGQYTMPSFISVSLFRSLSVHVGRQLQQNLGLEVYPVSYSSHFDFLYDILLASSWVFEIQYTEINALLSPGKKYHIVYFFGNYNGLKVTIGHIIR